MKRKPCPAARQILADLHADICAERFARNPSDRNRLAMKDARTAALAVR